MLAKKASHKTGNELKQSELQNNHMYMLKITFGPF